MKKKILAAALAALMVVAAGCGKKPEVTLGEYKGLALTNVTDEAVEEEITKALEKLAEDVEVERAAKDGDTVNINYTGKVSDDLGLTEDEAAGLVNDSEAGTDLKLGSGQFIDGFEAGLVGASAGDVVELNLTFPDPYKNNEKLAGQPVVFTVTVNTVKETVTPELTDEFVQENSDYETVEEYRTELRKALNEEGYYKQITEALMASSTVENLPKDRLQEQKDAFVSYYTQMADYYASMYKLDRASILQIFFGLQDEEALAEEGEKYADSVVRNQLVLEKIAEVEGLSVSDEKYNTEVELYAKEYGYETVEEFLKEAKEEDVRATILLDVVMEYLIENAIISDAE